jgi:hypothetical protein
VNLQNVTLESPGPVTIALQDGGNYEATLFDALVGRRSPLQLAIVDAKLSDSAWESISKLQCLTGLNLYGCNPTEFQLAAMKGLRNLTSLRLDEPKISETCVQELSKIGTLEDVSISGSLRAETIRCLVNNNPKLKSLEKRDGFGNVFNGTQFQGFDRLTVEEIKTALHELDLRNSRSHAQDGAP